MTTKTEAAETPLDAIERRAKAKGFLSQRSSYSGILALHRDDGAYVSFTAEGQLIRATPSVCCHEVALLTRDDALTTILRNLIAKASAAEATLAEMRRDIEAPRSDDVKARLQGHMLVMLREAGAKGVEQGDLVEGAGARLASERGGERHERMDAWTTPHELLKRRPVVIRARHEGTKRGHVIYLEGLKPLRRDELIRRYLDQRFTAPKGHCHACKGQLTGRQTRWCSQACSDLYTGLVSPTLGRAIAYQKSQVCALCEAPLFVAVAPGALGYEGERTYQLVSATGHVVERTERLPRGFSPAPTSDNWQVSWEQVRTPEMRDAELDHTIPLIEGGDHDWHNLRLLCKPCHASETASLAARRAAKRRHEKRKPSLPGVVG